MVHQDFKTNIEPQGLKEMLATLSQQLCTTTENYFSKKKSAQIIYLFKHIAISQMSSQIYITLNINHYVFSLRSLH